MGITTTASTSPPSAESEAMRNVFSTMTMRTAANPEMDLESMRDMLESMYALTAEPAGVTYEEVVAGKRPSLWCLPLDAAQDRVILFAHGGGFMGNSMHSHRKLAAHLARAAGTRALVFDFRLAPEHPFPAQLEDAVTAYRWLLDQGFEPGRIATAGDSAGGNLAISLVLKLRDDGLPLPAAIVAMSPWLDMEVSGQGFTVNAANDAFLSREVVAHLAATFLGNGGSPKDPLANLLYADPAGLPPVYMSYGGFEALRDNSERFAAIAGPAGVDVTLDLADGMQHDYMMMAGRAPEADQVIVRISKWLRPKLGLD
jgi:epsilon-lactone hydrolase